MAQQPGSDFSYINGKFQILESIRHSFLANNLFYEEVSSGEIGSPVYFDSDGLLIPQEENVQPDRCTKFSEPVYILELFNFSLQNYLGDRVYEEHFYVRCGKLASSNNTTSNANRQFELYDNCLAYSSDRDAGPHGLPEDSTTVTIEEQSIRTKIGLRHLGVHTFKGDKSGLECNIFQDSFRGGFQGEFQGGFLGGNIKNRHPIPPRSGAAYLFRKQMSIFVIVGLVMFIVFTTVLYKLGILPSCWSPMRKTLTIKIGE